MIPYSVFEALEFLDLLLELRLPRLSAMCRSSSFERRSKGIIAGS